MTLTALSAPDTFRGTVTAVQFCDIVQDVAQRHAISADLAPMADGGEGTLDVIKGEQQFAEVRGPLGTAVTARWALNDSDAVIEMSRASGWHALGTATCNALDATTYGTGELIGIALDAGASRIIVGAGGSVTTDGGLGALTALEPWLPLNNVDLIAATDVDTKFLDAARVFAPQKGADTNEVVLLEERLQQLAKTYLERFGVDVTEIPGSGSAGGLAGGLWCIGATIVPGFQYLAELIELEDRIRKADLVITGEGKFDETSLHGKVVGGVLKLAHLHDKPALVIAGVISHKVTAYAPDKNVTYVSLTDRFGSQPSLERPLELIDEVLDEFLVEFQRLRL